jgi:hypothetical protein
MSLEHLPPVWESWLYSDVQALTKQELESLLVLLSNKKDMVTDCYERALLHDDKHTYIQMKEFSYKYRDRVSERV